MPHSLAKKYHVVNDHSGCGVRLFQGSCLLQHCRGKGDEYHTATAFYLTTVIKKGMGLTQASGYHEENDQSRKTVDANKQISDRYYQSVDSRESDNLNQVNENREVMAKDMHRGRLLLRISPPYCIILTVTFTL
jgi:hypothetical protein